MHIIQRQFIGLPRGSFPARIIKRDQELKCQRFLVVVIVTVNTTIHVLGLVLFKYQNDSMHMSQNTEDVSWEGGPSAWPCYACYENVEELLWRALRQRSDLGMDDKNT